MSFILNVSILYVVFGRNLNTPFEKYSACNQEKCNFSVYTLHTTYLSMYCTSIMYAMQAASSPSKCTVGFNTVVLMPRFLPKTVKTDSIHNLVNYALVLC